MYRHGGMLIPSFQIKAPLGIFPCLELAHCLFGQLGCRDGTGILNNTDDSKFGYKLFSSFQNAKGSFVFIATLVPSLLANAIGNMIISSKNTGEYSLAMRTSSLILGASKSLALLPRGIPFGLSFLLLFGRLVRLTDFVI